MRESGDQTFWIESYAPVAEGKRDRDIRMGGTRAPGGYRVAGWGRV